MNAILKLRSDKRSFWCTNGLYAEILKEIKTIMSFSEFVKVSLVDKLKEIHPEKAMYYESLL